MSTIYINDLAGIHLDYWVARAEGLEAVREGGQCLVAGRRYAPTQDVQACGELVARHRVEIFDMGARWGAELPGSEAPWGNGETRTQAALRAIVAARFGDVVEDAQQEAAQSAAEAAVEEVVREPAPHAAQVSPSLSCFWLAFMAPGGAAARSLGHALFDAPDMDAAVARARELGLHPGSDVRVYRVNDEDAHHIPADLRNRALTAGEAAGLGWQDA